MSWGVNLHGQDRSFIPFSFSRRYNEACENRTRFYPGSNPADGDFYYLFQLRHSKCFQLTIHFSGCMDENLDNRVLWCTLFS